ARTGEQASESFHLVGHDWSGQIASSTAIRAPECVKTRSVLSCPTKIPRNSVPYAAEQRNVLGFNQLCAGAIEGAHRTFQALIEECPDFEWPYGNLGSLLIQMGDIDAARDVLHKALSLNPDYTNAWLHLARLHALESDFAAAYECLARVAEIDPDEPA